MDFFAAACALQPVGSLVLLTQNDKDFVILNASEVSKNSLSCHTELSQESEVSINLKYEFFAIAQNDKTAWQSKSKRILPQLTHNFFYKFLKFLSKISPLSIKLLKFPKFPQIFQKNDTKAKIYATI